MNNNKQDEVRIEFSKDYEDKSKSVHIRPTSNIYKAICESLCDLATKDEKWGYVWFQGMMLTFDLSLFKQTGGQAIPDTISD